MPSAASARSTSRRWSGRFGIDHSRLGQHLVADETVQAAPGAQVDRAAEQFGQLVAEVGDLPAEPGTGREYVEQVEVAVRAFLAARYRAEHGQFNVALRHVLPMCGFPIW